jgi:hypothetical protein
LACVATAPQLEKKATPWGTAVLVDRVTLPQRAGEKRFATMVELLATEKGEHLVRFAYSTDGTARRGPVTLRERDLARLRAALDGHPELGRLLQSVGGGERR